LLRATTWLNLACLPASGGRSGPRLNGRRPMVSPLADRHAGQVL